MQLLLPLHNMDYQSPMRLDDLVANILSESYTPKVEKPDVPFSKKQIDLHYDDLYLGYLKKLSEIKRRLRETSRNKSNSTYSDYRSLKKEELFTINAVYMHELFFENLKKNKLQPIIEKHLVQDFGSISKWEDDFIAAGMAARGWAVLCYDHRAQKLTNVICDAHDSGGLWSATPILVLDTYEHSFNIDFLADKPKYIDFFMGYVNWEIVSTRLSNLT